MIVGLFYGAAMVASTGALVISGVVTDKFWPGLLCFSFGCALGCASMLMFTA